MLTIISPAIDLALSSFFWLAGGLTLLGAARHERRALQHLDAVKRSNADFARSLQFAQAGQWDVAQTIMARSLAEDIEEVR